MIPQRRGPASRRAAQVDPAAQSQKKLVGLEVARFLLPDPLVNVMAVFEGPSAERPDPGEEETQGVVLQVEPVNPLGIRPGSFELPPPELADVEKMLEGIVLGPNAFAESGAKSGGVVNRSEVEEGVEFLFLQRGDVVEGIGSASNAKPKRSRNARVCRVWCCKSLTNERVDPDSTGSSKRKTMSRSEHGVSSARPVPPRAATANGRSWDAPASAARRRWHQGGSACVP